MTSICWYTLSYQIITSDLWCRES